MPALLLAVLTTLASGPPVLPDDPVSAEPLPEPDAVERGVAEAVAGLAAGGRRERFAAERALRAVGPVALDHLPPDGDAGGPGAAFLLGRVRADLRRTIAAAALAPARVTFDGTHPLAEWLDAVATRSGNGFDAAALAPATLARPVTLAAGDEPFWSVTARLADAAGVAIGPIAGGRLALVPDVGEADPGDAGAVSVAGPFRVTAGPGTTRPVVGGGGTLLRIPVSVTPEPRLAGLFAAVPGDALAATAADGRALAPFSPGAKREVPFVAGTARFTAAFLVPPAARGGRGPVGPVRLTGAVRVELAAGVHEFTFDDPPRSDSAPVRRGAVTARLRSAGVGEPDPATGSPRVLTVTLLVEYAADATDAADGPEDGLFESHRTWRHQNDAALVAADGGRLLPDGPVEAVAESGRSLALRYRFREVPADLSGRRFVYRAPTVLTAVDVAVGFDAVPVE